jgi:cyclic pyranopterin phosphate synthase
MTSPVNGPAPGRAGGGHDVTPEGRPPVRLTHLDEAGAARMVDVSAKPETVREAVAGARLVVEPETAALLAAGGLPKGDALAVARVAGIMGAKRTADLIPLCHPLPLTAVEVDLEVLPAAVEIRATARTTARTGVEMEALTSATVAALALYDMVKGVQRDARIEGVRLLEKRGGRSGEYIAPRRDPAGPDEPAPRPGGED